MTMITTSTYHQKLLSVLGNIEICLTLHRILKTFNKGEMNSTDIVFTVLCGFPRSLKREAKKQLHERKVFILRSS